MHYLYLIDFDIDSGTTRKLKDTGIRSLVATSNTVIVNYDGEDVEVPIRGPEWIRGKLGDGYTIEVLDTVSMFKVSRVCYIPGAVTRA